MAKGLNTTRKALDKLKADQARLKDKIRQQKDQLKQAEAAQQRRQALAIGRMAMGLLPNDFIDDGTLLTGFLLSAEDATPLDIDQWRKDGEQHLKPEDDHHETP